MKKADGSKPHKPFRVDKSRSEEIKIPVFDPLDFSLTPSSSSLPHSNSHSNSNSSSASNQKQPEKISDKPIAAKFESTNSELFSDLKRENQNVISGTSLVEIDVDHNQSIMVSDKGSNHVLDQNPSSNSEQDSFAAKLVNISGIFNKNFGKKSSPNPSFLKRAQGFSHSRFRFKAIKNKKSESQKLLGDDFAANKTNPSLENLDLIRKIIFKFANNPKTFGAVFALILFLFGAVYFLPKSFENSSLKFYLASNLTKALGANFSIKGNVDLVLLPRPKLIARDVFLENYHQRGIWHNQNADEKTEDKNPNKTSSAKDSSQILESSELNPTGDIRQLQGQIGEEAILYHDYLLNFYAKTIEIEIPLFGSNSVKKISAEGALFELRQENVTESPLGSKFKSIFANFPGKEKLPEISENLENRGLKEKLFSIDSLSKNFGDSLKMPNVEIHGSEIVFLNKTGSYLNFREVDVEFKNDDKSMLVNGSFVSEEVKSNFEADLNFNSSANNPDSFLKISSDFVDIAISGVLTGENAGIFSDFDGKIEAEIKNFKKFYRSFISNSDVVSSSLVEGVGGIKTTAEIKNKNRKITFKDWVFNSTPFSAKFDIFIRQAVSRLKNILIIDFAGTIENLNLDSFWLRGEKSAEKKLQPSEIASFLANFNQNLPNKEISPPTSPLGASTQIKSVLNKVLKDIDLSADLQFKKVIFKNSEFADASLYLTISNRGKISISPLLFRLGDKSIFRINGVFDSDLAEGWKFVGNFDSAGEDFGANLKAIGFNLENLRFETLKKFRLNCDLSFNQESFNFSRVYLNLNQGESEISGEVKVANNKTARIVASNLRISRFRVEDYLSMQKNSYLSPGLLTKKMFWLNEINDYHNINLKFDELIYKDQNLINQEFRVTLGPGYVKIPNTLIRSQKNDLNFELSIDMAEKNQIFKLALNARNLFINSRKSANDPELRPGGSYNFFDRFYNLPSGEKFDGDISIAVDNFQFDEKLLNNFFLKGNIHDGIINPIQIGFDGYGGHFDFKGLLKIGLEKIINGSFSLKQAQIKELLNDLLSIEAISGTANISGNLVSSASVKEEFLQKLSSEVSLGVSLPAIQGYGINDLIRKLFQTGRPRRDLFDPESTLFSSASKSVFKEAKGFISIKNGNEGKFKVKISAPVVNSVFYGNLAVEKKVVNGTLNTIFLTGDGDIKTPLNIAMNLKYRPKTLVYVSNIDQLRHHLGLEKIEPKSVIVDNGQKIVGSGANQEKEKEISVPLANSSNLDLEQLSKEIDGLGQEKTISKDNFKEGDKLKNYLLKETSTEPVDKNF